MVNTNYVRVGRLVRIRRGPRENKVAVITDIIDSNRVLVENPEDKKMWRHVQNIKNIEPTKFVTPLARNAKTVAVKSAMESKSILAKWSKTGASKKIEAAKAIAASTDFERYQLRVAKRSRAHWARKIFDENDKKTPVSWNRVLAKKLSKNHSKFEKKHSELAKKMNAKKAKRTAAKAKKTQKK